MFARSPRISRTFLQRDIRGGPCTRISRNIWLQSSSIILKGNLDFVGCGLWHLWVVGCLWVLGCVVHFMLCDFRKKHVATTSIILIQNQQNTLLNKISHSDISWYTRLRPLFGILPIKSEVTSSIGKLIQHQLKCVQKHTHRHTCTDSQPQSILAKQCGYVQQSWTREGAAECYKISIQTYTRAYKKKHTDMHRQTTSVHPNKALRVRSAKLNPRRRSRAETCVSHGYSTLVQCATVSPASNCHAAIL